MRRLVSIGVLILVALLSGLATGSLLYYYLVYFLVAALGGSLVWSWLNLRGVSINAQRQVTRAQVGDYVESRLTIRNIWPLPKLMLEVQDLVSLPGQITGRIFNLSPGQEVQWQPRTPMRKRGLYPLGPIQVFSSDVFRIFRHRLEIPATQEMLVYPRPVDLPLFDIPQIESVHEGMARQRAAELTPLASSIREYTPTDSYKRIHWPSSVRSGRLMVKEFDTDQGTRFWIALDLEQGVQAGGEVENTEEYGVTVALSLAKKYLTLSWPVSLMAQGDREYLVQTGRGLGSLGRVLDILAIVRAEGQVPLADVLGQLGRWIRPPSTLVIITPSIDPAWVAALVRMTRRKIQVAAILLDPESFGGHGTAQDLVPLLLDQGILSYVLRQGDPLDQILAYPNALRPAAFPAAAE